MRRRRRRSGETTPTRSTSASAPARRDVASATFRGPYDKIRAANAAVAAWVRDNGYAFDGPAFNIYHVNPSETDDPEEYVTEVCYPVKKRA